METISAEQSKTNNELMVKLDDQIKANRDLQQQLGEQASMNNSLRQQLELEQLHAGKEQEDRVAMMRCIDQLNESLCVEQTLLEAQLNQITERRNDISGCLTDLQVIQ